MGIPWKVESFQFVSFTLPSEQVDAFTVWHELFKATPDNYQRQPEPNNLISNATGRFAGFNFQIQSAPGRIDLFLMGENSGPFPLVANDDGGKAVFKEKALQLANLRTTLRLAFVTQLFCDHTTLNDANNSFYDATGIKNPGVVVGDLMFMMNARKSVSKPELTINRICRWNSLVKQVMQIQIVNNVQTSQGVTFEQPALTVNIDVNSVPLSLPIAPAKVSGILEHLFDEYEFLKVEGYHGLVS